MQQEGSCFPVACSVEDLAGFALKKPVVSTIRVDLMQISPFFDPGIFAITDASYPRPS